MEQIENFFNEIASKEQVVAAMLRVLGSVDVEANAQLKNDRDMLITFVETLL